MKDDRSRHRDGSADRQKDDLVVKKLEELDERGEIDRYAFYLVCDKEEAKDYAQDARLRFLSAMRNKTLEEIKRVSPQPYIHAVLRSIHADRSKKMRQPRERDDDNLLDKQSRRKYELPAAQLGTSVEDIANRQQEEGKIQSTELGVEDQVVSGATFEELVSRLPREKLRALARLLFAEHYTLSEVAEEWGEPYAKLAYQSQVIVKILREVTEIMQKQEQLEEVGLTHGK
jgi:DNA-directed RNA polymerase specialized sigma24 family protein